jgi:hypothetical protein
VLAVLLGSPTTQARTSVAAAADNARGRSQVFRGF